MDGGGAVTFEDLAIDDTLTDLERVVRYSRSNIALQRLVHLRMLTDTAASVGFALTHEHLVPLLGPLSQDPEVRLGEAGSGGGVRKGAGMIGGAMGG
jgi:serine/threonine-protein phosphatase 4 regulatory subunit 1